MVDIKQFNYQKLLLCVVGSSCAFQRHSLVCFVKNLNVVFIIGFAQTLI